LYWCTNKKLLASGLLDEVPGVNTTTTVYEMDEMDEMVKGVKAARLKLCNY
jgi:hypothetical protein